MRTKLSYLLQFLAGVLFVSGAFQNVRIGFGVNYTYLVVGILQICVGGFCLFYEIRKERKEIAAIVKDINERDKKAEEDLGDVTSKQQ